MKLHEFLADRKTKGVQRFEQLDRHYVAFESALRWLEEVLLRREMSIPCMSFLAERLNRTLSQTLTGGVHPPGQLTMPEDPARMLERAIQALRHADLTPAQKEQIEQAVEEARRMDEPGRYPHDMVDYMPRERPVAPSILDEADRPVDEPPIVDEPPPVVEEPPPVIETPEPAEPTIMDAIVRKLEDDMTGRGLQPDEIHDAIDSMKVEKHADRHDIVVEGRDFRGEFQVPVQNGQPVPELFLAIRWVWK